MFTANKRRIVLGCLVATCTAAAVPAGASAKPTITMSGSTTVAPLAAKLARGYLRAFPGSVRFRCSRADPTSASRTCPTGA